MRSQPATRCSRRASRASGSSASIGRSASASAFSNTSPVSGTPIRSVLSRLEAEGLVRSRHGVGTFVTDVDIEELAQVYQLRMELAVLLGRLDPIPRSHADVTRVR